MKHVEALTADQRKYVECLAFAKAFRKAHPAAAKEAWKADRLDERQEFRNLNREAVRKYNREYMATRRAKGL